ncbi:aminotransferase class I/II-fold pyridoxal phosphate-dependent enzyme [Zunongwangia sp. SCSIO 43204]|uniref:GNAT family N-acetyltransferase n=1 Tax=Zunongwangia sp. SCSIO 43204 TaxID=2779359 RepID=UPI001CA9E9FC|nr:GNAT family N-acetyltransferase [Zunongwangia sp. SCSIO 43204]UAB84173.1 aminotransferase class I/II-fold pyridoxal phosphate-dependent enzyme [Zunongwangia sp. SCSIO 43204]
MAKIKYNNILNTVISVMTSAKESGALHLYADGNAINGRKLQIDGKELFNFGTTGYLGLEQDERLKQGAIQAIQAYGTEFPMSKSYVSHPLYRELETLLSKIYNDHFVVVTKNSTLGHLGVIPSVVNDGDGIILDHQVHWSVQSAVQPLKLRSVPVEMIRHNNLDMLEEKLKKLQSKCNKIWFMADGMYSMYGDYAPIEDLIGLAKRYSQLYLYFDDVHGMSWKGTNGSGYVMSILKELPEKVILISTLSKTFGASGAVMVCKDQKIQERIKNFGGPLTFSIQLDPAAVGAAIASAKIHLSPEIYQLQKELYDRISCMDQCLKNTRLPLITHNDSPIFYIGTGMPETGFNLIKRLIAKGFYTNLGIFPAVPIKNTGLRISISRHNQQKDIEDFVNTLQKEYPKALYDTGTNINRVSAAFGRTIKGSEKSKQLDEKLSLKKYNSIKEISPSFWNERVGNNSFYDWDGLVTLEKIFKHEKTPEHQLQFFYFNILDQNEKCILSTFFTYGLWKEDMLAPSSVSVRIEKERESNPYYHTSYCLCMGSMVTEGNHLFLDRDNKLWKQAFDLLLEQIEILDKKLNPDYVILRDFDQKDTGIKLYLHKKGFIQVAMPESAVFDTFEWKDQKEYIQSLSKRSRKHFRKEILAFENDLKIVYRQSLSNIELLQCYRLYQSVKNQNLGLNTFSYPFSLFTHMKDAPQWEFILISLKEPDQNLVGVMFCYKNKSGIYTPAIIGMDYTFAYRYNIYRHLLYHTIKRSKALDYKRVDFGLTAGFEKRKLGAKIIEKCAYLQAKDNFAMESLEWLRTD